MVSDGWVSLRLGDFCTKIGSGATPRGGKEVYLEEGPYALIRSQNVYNSGFNYDGSSTWCRLWADRLLHEINHHPSYFDSQPVALRSQLQVKGKKSPVKWNFNSSY